MPVSPNPRSAPSTVSSAVVLLTKEEGHAEVEVLLTKEEGHAEVEVLLMKEEGRAKVEI